MNTETQAQVQALQRAQQAQIIRNEGEQLEILERKVPPMQKMQEGWSDLLDLAENGEAGLGMIVPALGALAKIASGQVSLLAIELETIALMRTRYDAKKQAFESNIIGVTPVPKAGRPS